MQEGKLDVFDDYADDIRKLRRELTEANATILAMQSAITKLGRLIDTVSNDLTKRVQAVEEEITWHAEQVYHPGAPVS